MDGPQPATGPRLKALRITAGLAAFAALAVAGMAVAANLTSSRHNDFFAAGTHKFYLWCGGREGRVAFQPGASADAAQAALYASEKAKGETRCWPVWQARVAAAE